MQLAKNATNDCPGGGRYRTRTGQQRSASGKCGHNDRNALGKGRQSTDDGRLDGDKVDNIGPIAPVQVANVPDIRKEREWRQGAPAPCKRMDIRASLPDRLRMIPDPGRHHRIEAG